MMSGIKSKVPALHHKSCTRSLLNRSEVFYRVTELQERTQQVRGLKGLRLPFPSESPTHLKPETGE